MAPDLGKPRLEQKRLELGRELLLCVWKETLCLGDREGSPIPRGMIILILVLGELRRRLGRVAGSQGKGIRCHKLLVDLVFPSSTSWRKESVGHIS